MVLNVGSLFEHDYLFVMDVHICILNSTFLLLKLLHVNDIISIKPNVILNALLLIKLLVLFNIMCYAEHGHQKCDRKQIIIDFADFYFRDVP